MDRGRFDPERFDPAKATRAMKKGQPDWRNIPGCCGNMNKGTIFTWGYYGWGSCTPQLVQAVDAVEMSRGFEPPTFVDIRIRRNVRAKGFVGNAFEKLMGPSRHRWMKSLGNKFIQTRTGPDIQIAEPSAADTLLDLALESAGRKRRVLFFCGCQWPRCDGEIACHRSTVADLVLKAVKRCGESVEIVEWPGGEPKQVGLEVTPQIFAAVKRGRMTVPLGATTNLAQMAGLPWGSIATLHSNGEELHRIVGPAICQTEQWALPVLSLEPATDLAEYEDEARTLRRRLGLRPA
jgi:hypothetical protein